MKVLHLITTIEFGGAENQLLLLAREQVKSGMDVSVAPLKGRLDLTQEFLLAGVAIDKTLHQVSFIRQITRLRKILRSEKHRSLVLHCHLPQAELLASISNSKSYIVSRHFGDQFYPRKSRYLSSKLSKIALRNCELVIAISHSVKNSLFQLNEIPHGLRVEVIPYGFDALHFVSLCKKNLVNKKDIPKDKNLKVSTFARLSEEKDLKTLLKAVSTVGQYRKIKLSIFGEGKNEAELRQFGDSLGLDMRQILKGKTNDVCNEMSKSDVIVMTSKFEGFGMVFLEAMALHKPIISSDIQIAKEVLGENGAAVFFQVGDAEALAYTIKNFESLLNDNFIAAQKERLACFDVVKMEREIYEKYSENYPVR